MEIYAAFLEYADYHVGRVIDTLQDLEILDDTLVYYIIGDNGASAEGTLIGSTNEMIIAEAPDLHTPQWMIDHIDELGTPKSYNHYAVGWAHAMDTPYQWTKQVASHFGGTRNGTVVHWPNGFAARGEMRTQFSHVIDVAPTVLEAAGLPFPTLVNGVLQEPLHGTSMAYAFDDASAAERHQTQYFEMLCNRGIYHQGWTAVTRHHIPWIVRGSGGTLDEDVWELYDTNSDWTQARDLAATRPDVLARLKRLFEIEAAKYNVLPLDPRMIERTNPDIAGRPQTVIGKTQLLFRGMRRIPENVFINIKDKSHSVTAAIEVPESGGSGVLIAQGGISGGWSLYVHQGRLEYCYNVCGARYFYVTADSLLPAGSHQARLEFAYDGGGYGKGGAVSLYLDGTRVGEGRVERTHPFAFSLDETTDVGVDTGSPVSEDYGPQNNAFNGTVQWAQIDVDEAAADPDHTVSAEERFHVVMARQ